MVVCALTSLLSQGRLVSCEVSSPLTRKLVTKWESRVRRRPLWRYGARAHEVHWVLPEWRTLLCSVYSWLLECNNMHRLHKWVPQENTDSALRHCSTSRVALSLLKKDDNGNVEMVVTHKKKAKRFSCVNQIHIVWQENNSVSSEDLGSLKFLWKKVQHSESGWYAHDLFILFSLR